MLGAPPQSGTVEAVAAIKESHEIPSESRQAPKQ